MLSDSRFRKLRHHFVPSSMAIATAVFGHRLRQVKGKRQVFFLSGSCFSFNDLLQRICSGSQVLLSVKKISQFTESRVKSLSKEPCCWREELRCGRVVHPL